MQIKILGFICLYVTINIILGIKDIVTYKQH